MKRILVVVVIAALLLAVARLAASRLAAGVAPGDGAAGSDRAPIAQRSEAAAPGRGEGAGSGDGASGERRRAETRTVLEVAGEPGLEVLVVDGATGAPVAGADVRWWRAPEGVGRWQAERLFERAFRTSALDALAGELGGAVTSDGAGRAVLEDAEGIGCVVAAAEGAWGRLHGSAEASAPLTVHLFRDFDLRARVVDAAGRPVEGVAAAFRVRWGDWAPDFVTALTDARGHAELRHAGASLGRDQIADGWCLVALAELLDPPVEVRFEFDAPPTEPVELVAPACGACELRVIDEHGRLATEPLDLALELGFDPAQPVDERREPLILFHDDVEGGVAHFPLVTTGRELVATVQRAGGVVEHVARAAGPSAPGELARITVRLGESAPSVSGRVVDALGRALAEAELQGRVAIAGERWEHLADLRTDAAGRFVLDLAPEPDASVRRELVLTREDAAGVELERARLALPVALVQGRHELGDVALGPSPLLASGRVVGADGHPIAGARVTSYRRVYSQRDPTQFSWMSFFQPTTRTDAAGRFTLRGEADEETLGLDASHGTIASERLVVPAGSEDVVLSIGPVGALAGRVLLGPSADVEELRVGANIAGLDDLDGEEPPNARASAAVAPDGSFLLEHLRPGPWVVGFRDTGEPLGYVEDVEIVGGETVRDPRLDPFDLRGVALARAMHLRIVDEAGAPIPRGEVQAHVWRGAEPEHVYETSFVNGEAELALRETPVELTLTAHGFLSLRLLDVAEDRTIAMQRGPLVRFALTGVDPPQPPLWVELQLERAEPQFGVFMEQRQIDLGPDGTGLFRTPFTGAGRVELWLIRDRGLGRDSAALGSERLVDIADGSQEQRLELPLTPAELASALQRLDG